MENPWMRIDTEKTRVMAFKSQPGVPLNLTNVTHFKKREHGGMLKCDQGIVYFEFDDVAYIVSDCKDWMV